MMPDTFGHFSLWGILKVKQNLGGIHMSKKTWEVVKVHYCHHVKEEVGLEAQVVYPADWLPDQPPRIAAQRQSCATRMDVQVVFGQGQTR
jgi:hypothetical protein